MSHHPRVSVFSFAGKLSEGMIAHSLLPLNVLVVCTVVEAGDRMAMLTEVGTLEKHTPAAITARWFLNLHKPLISGSLLVRVLFESKWLLVRRQT